MHEYDTSPHKMPHCPICRQELDVAPVAVKSAQLEKKCEEQLEGGSKRRRTGNDHARPSRFSSPRMECSMSECKVQ